jgi:hypothetical protein
MWSFVISFFLEGCFVTHYTDTRQEPERRSHSIFGFCAKYTAGRIGGDESGLTEVTTARQANRGNSVNNSIAEKNSGPALHPITYVP